MFYYSRSAADITLRQFSALIGDVNRPIGREYEDIVEKIYDADYIPVNFKNIEGTLREVNDVVSRNTNGQIREAVTREDLLKVNSFMPNYLTILIKISILVGTINFIIWNQFPRQMEECLQYFVHKARTIQRLSR